MRATRNFTLVLDRATAAHVEELTRYFGGTVGRFAANWVRDLAQLDPDELVSLRHQIAALAEQKRKKFE